MAEIRSGTTTLTAPDPRTVTGKDRKDAIAKFQGAVKAELAAAGYPDKADPTTIDKPMVVLMLFILVLYVTMVYGPIAAMLVELFPARIRYSAMSLPTTSGTGGLEDFCRRRRLRWWQRRAISTMGLWYPIVIAGANLVIGLFFLPEIFKRDVGA